MATKENIKETVDEAVEEKVAYYIEDDYKEPHIVEVWLNGVRYLLPKGETHEVPPGVKEILEHSKRMKKEKRDRIAAAKAKAKGL